MLKAMMFIDGTWFDTNFKKLRRVEKFYIEHIKFEPIWDAVRAHLKMALGFDIDLVRTICVAGHPNPDKVAANSLEFAERMVNGWKSLRRLPCMSVDLYPYDYFGGELFPVADVDASVRRPVPKEKCVDVALATKMLYFAAVPGAYDVAVLVTGDRDYEPVVKAVRSLGKRAMLASFLELDSCSRQLKEEAALGELWDLKPLDLGPVVRGQLDGWAARGVRETS